MILTTSLLLMFATSPAGFEGSFTYVGDKNEQAEIVRQVEAAAQDVPILFRSTALAKMMEYTKPPQTLTFTKSGDKLTLTVTHGSITAKTDGTESPVPGTKNTVKLLLKGNTLTQVTKAEKGTRTYVYTLSADGKTMSVDADIYFSKRQKTALKYKLSYRRS